MSNSSLVTCTMISPNKTSPRNHAIDTITIHCVVGQLTAKGIGNCFISPKRKASSNYGVGKDGSIGLYVDENDRSWCTSSSSNDNRAITIEVASDTTHPYAVTDAAYNALINLVADICKRNNIKKLLWKADKSLIGKVDQQNMTVHRWFANKSCPGEYLYSRHSDIANKVNDILDNRVTLDIQPVLNTMYRVRKSWDDEKSQKGAFTNLDNAINLAKRYRYNVYDGNGKQVYPNVKDYDQMARDVLNGKYGNGKERREKLGADYSKVQAIVNKLLK